MAQVIGLRAPEEGQKALDAVMRVLGYDAELANRFWSMKDPPGMRTSPEAIGEDVLMKLYPLQTLRTRKGGQTDPILRNIPPAAATAMHLGREMATPLNTGLSLIPAFNALRRARLARTATPSAPTSAPPTSPVPTGEESPSLGGVTRRDVLKGLALAPVIAAGAGAGAKTLERLLTKEAPYEKYAKPITGGVTLRAGGKDYVLTDKEFDEWIKTGNMPARVGDAGRMEGREWLKTGRIERLEGKAAKYGQLAGKYEKMLDKDWSVGETGLMNPTGDFRKAFDGLERMRKAGQYEGRYAKLIDERMKMKSLHNEFNKTAPKYGLFRKEIDLRAATKAEIRIMNKIDKLGVQMQKQAERVWQEWSKLQQ